tara:strand:- start:130 stop:366 length:237 start_codon:yes stop_codon:yes gene_type:complete
MSNSIREKQYNKLFIRLSGHFLAVHLEDDFFELTEEKQMEYIKEYAWQPFEYHDPEDVYTLIDNLTYEVMNIIEGIEE